MTKQKVKARSDTTESNDSIHRPMSRASTTSVQTVGEQANVHSRRASEIGLSATIYTTSHHHPFYHQDNHIESQPFQSHPYAANVIDPSLQDNNIQDIAGYHYYGQQPLRNNQVQLRGRDDTPFMNPEDDREESVAPDGQKKKGASTNIANEQELRRLFQENKHRSLREISVSVLAEERGPRSEKTKQIFAMIW